MTSMAPSCLCYLLQHDANAAVTVQDDEIDFADQQKAGSIQHKQQYEHDFAEKQRLQKMQQDHSQFQEQIVSRRQGEFEELQVSCLAAAVAHHTV